MNKDKVYLKGYVIGRAVDTLGYQGLMVQLENLDIVEIDKNLVHKKIDEPQPIKLKDVIARIKKLDLGTQKVWLNEILNELGSDYGTLKYKTGYEQGKLEGLIERENVMITQDVADYIEYAKEYDWDLQDAMDSDFIASEENRNLSDWFYKDKNMETFALAWINGYDVEKEKRYLVKVKNMSTRQRVLNRNKKSKDFIFANQEENTLYATKFTRKELEESGFGWVFYCPGIEIEEVENE